MTVNTALLLAFIAGFSYFSRRFMGDMFLERPIIIGPVVGLILGDLKTGLFIGAELELIFMGVALVGGTAPANMAVGSVLGTAFAITLGEGLEAAIAIALPGAVLGSFLEQFAKILSSATVIRGADKYASEGNENGIQWMLHLGNAIHFLAYFIPTFLALRFGSVYVESLFGSFPAWLRAGLSASASILPVLGFGMLLTILGDKKVLPFFFIGFFIAIYTSFGVVGVSAMAVAVALVLEWQKNRIIKDAGIKKEVKEVATKAVDDMEFYEKGDVKKVFWRSFAIGSAFNYERYQGLGFCFSMIPVLRRLYKGTEEFAPALQRHMLFYNSNTWLPGIPLGVAATMEARRKQIGDVSEDAITGMKSALMGPLAGIGDSLFWLTVRPIVGGIAVAMALDGNTFAPLFFFIMMNVVHLAVRWYATKYGFSQGTKLVDEVSGDKVQTIMTIATEVGLMSVGALVGTWLNITTPLVFTQGETSLVLQDMLNKIMPKMLPLIATILVALWYKKGGKPWMIMLALIGIGLVFGGLGILA
ncbi:PTS system mannose/fructose/sorbose family transporter subunit IID [Pelolinea submarina]|uniref:PTS system mannose-specific IID component n=1 Tax=Pelolinea submarina TaxID=913107 RepID=A0A347ZWF1_9CHLR|nr:PTS system mannose/fructose/sorbose family transporter subunit IID [Pelolinea submarina]REG05375.1 PTS system mannose-specific IID component [Pelolinea submarina]BBB49632.1 PTS system, mannose-specific IID component [Pelolinea submarina]